MDKVYTVNAWAKDGNSYPLYFHCMDKDVVRKIIDALDLFIDEDAGICEMVAGEGYE